MRLLDRYLLRELITPLAFCLGFFLVLWTAFDLFEQLRVLMQNKLTAADIIAYELLRMPELLGVVLPVALLLASLYALTQHARHHELTAIRAAGVSLWRLAMPYLGVGLLGSGAMFLNGEYLAPDASARAEKILNRNAGLVETGQNPFVEVLFVTRTGQKWKTYFNVRTQTLRDVQIDWQKPDGSRLNLAAAAAGRANQAWVFTNVQMHYYRPGDMFPANRIFTNALALPEFAESPEMIASDIKITRQSNKKHVEQTQIPLTALLNYLHLHPQMPPEKRAWIETQIQSRLASPFMCIVVVLIAIPFGAASGRRNVFMGVAGSLFICLVYFVLLQLGLALGASGKVPPWVGAWLPNFFFGLAGLVLTFRVR